jgi:hypothetical protein
MIYSQTRGMDAASHQRRNRFMSAAATAAGYLYASGRLRGRNAQEHEEKQPEGKRPRAARVAVLPTQEQPARPKKVPKIQYRTRRWKPDEHA